MESKSLRHITVTLHMDELEAQWLKSTMQNPLHGISLTDESQTDRTMREIFFTALKKELD